MQIILQNNGNIIYGPAEYSVNMIAYTLMTDLGMLQTDFVIPSKFEAPILINASTSILPATLVYPNLNSKIEQLSGPFWTFTATEATGTYEVAPKSLDSVKNDLKATIAANRYVEETKDLTLTVAGTEVIVEGSRENKTIFLLSYPMLSDVGTTNWKFPKSGNFVACSKADIAGVIQAMMTQTQVAFDWEASKFAEVDACVDLAALDLIVTEVV